MNALARGGLSDDAVKVFRDMIARKLEPGLVACNFVLTHFSKNSAGDAALEFLRIMKKVFLMYVCMVMRYTFFLSPFFVIFFHRFFFSVKDKKV